ncbi:hypothetical protein EK904_010320 [Melospiza melodia maxima]|nr:hypothetical protein EK904_010320 [Melospiza melodia maxima]
MDGFFTQQLHTRSSGSCAEAQDGDWGSAGSSLRSCSAVRLEEGRAEPPLINRAAMGPQGRPQGDPFCGFNCESFCDLLQGMPLSPTGMCPELLDTSPTSSYEEDLAERKYYIELRGYFYKKYSIRSSL